MTPFVSSALAQGGGDVDILNFALTLEYLETAFYKKGRSLGLSSSTAKLAREFGDQEAQHVSALIATVKKLGGTPVKMPTFSFPVTNEASFLKLAQTLEDTGVSAYNGAAPAISSKAILAAAGSIVQVEARHAAALNTLVGKDITPDGGFAKPASMAEVLPIAKQFIVEG